MSIEVKVRPPAKRTTSDSFLVFVLQLLMARNAMTDPPESLLV